MMTVIHCSMPPLPVPRKVDLGGIENYVDKNLPFFDPPLHGQFLYSERGQKQTFFDPLPPHLVHVVIERSLVYTPLIDKN